MSNHSDFWHEIGQQLEAIKDRPADTFAKVRAILQSSDYPAVREDVNRNGVREFGAGAAFFAGSGGDATLAAALRAAGWRTVWAEASYYYVMRHSETGETLTYCEGDVLRGVPAWVGVNA